MVFAFKFQVFLMRFFWRIKSTYTNTLTINHNLCAPFTLMRANTQKSNFIGFGCFSHILQIAKSINLSQICKRIIKFVSVNMVNVTIRHIASNIKPSQSMRQSFGVMNSNRNVAVTMDRASNFSYKIGAPTVFTPSKNASLRIVMKRFAQMFNRNVRFRCHNIQFTIKVA